MGLARLAGFIKRWCDDHGRISQAEFARRAGISRMTLYNIQQGAGTDLRSDTKEGIERVLGWKAGSVDSVLSGGDSTPVEPATPPPASAPAVAQDSQEVSGGGRAIAFGQVIEHLIAADALGYGWEALERMRSLHSPLVKRPRVEPTQSHDTDRSA